MPLRVRDGSEKWGAVAGVAGASWVAATTEAAGRWKTAVSAQNFGQNWQAAVNTVQARLRFVAGLQRMTQAIYAERVTAAGAERYQSGVRNAIARYRRGFAPYATALANATLTPRGPKGPDNVRRVTEVVNLMIATKAAQTGGTDTDVGQQRYVPQNY